MSPTAPKRFYENVDVSPVGDRYAVVLDGRPVRTPMKSKLELPSYRLAVAVAEEWDAQVEKIDLASMSMTGFASSAIDRVATRRDEVVSELAGYAETDMLCYRADEPEELVRRQQEAWQPPLDWLAAKHGAQLRPTSGIMHVRQSSEALERIRGLVAVREDFALMALHALTTGMGSIVLALAVSEGALGIQEAVDASQLDEIFQSEVWGEDIISAERRARVASELMQAEAFLGLLLAEA